jgi:hypothetical protein
MSLRAIVVHDSGDPILVQGRVDDNPANRRFAARMFLNRCIIETAGYSRDEQTVYLGRLAAEATRIGDRFAEQQLVAVVPIMVREYAALGCNQVGHA